MTDKELIARLLYLSRVTRDYDQEDMTSADYADMPVATKEAADRIEALTKERDTAREYAGEVRKREMAVEDARISATDKLATCEKYRDAYAEMGRIGTQAVRDLETKLAKAVEALEDIARPKVGPDFDWTEDETNKWRAVWYRKYQDIALATLAEIKGGNDAESNL